MPVIPLAKILPAIASKETKAVGVIKDIDIPDGAYQFEEMFCDNPHCDCREALIEVYAQTITDVPLAVIRYRWDRPESYRDESGLCRICRSGAELLPNADQSAIAEPLLDLFAECVEDENYAHRIARHYKLFKAAVAATGTALKVGKARKAR